MELVLDKVTLLVIAALASALLPFTPAHIVASLAAVSVSALFDVDTLPRTLRAGAVYLYLALSLAFPAFISFLPLVSYDCFRLSSLFDEMPSERAGQLRMLWVAPLLVAFVWLQPGMVLLLLLVSCLACLRAWSSGRASATLADYRARRDELSAVSKELEMRNRDLEERKSLELRLATLAERSRLAREIHDNVGHLLTRSILQVEAHKVTQASEGRDDPQLTAISDTLHEAYDSLRESVHALHEESFELRSQLQMLAQETAGLPRTNAGGGSQPLRVALDYGLADPSPPQPVSYSLLAITREALANTIKHSDATSVQVSLKEFPGFYQLTIQDNGGTEPPQGYAATKGIGLASMEERARSFGGVLNTSWDSGFRVFATIPKAID